MSNNAKCITKG